MRNLEYGIKNKQLIELKKESILEGFRQSYVYEVIRLIRTRPLFFSEHYQRLINSCESLNIQAPPREQILRDIESLVFKNQLSDINIKIAIDSENNAVFPIDSSYPSEYQYSRGVYCEYLHQERKQPHLKINQSALREKSDKQIETQKIYESILVNSEGLITEGSRSNLFFIQGQKLFTSPHSMVLSGITREKVLNICQKKNYTIIYEALSIDQLSNIEAAFICGTSPGIMPINRIEDQSFDVKNTVLQNIHRTYHQKYLDI